MQSKVSQVLVRKAGMSWKTVPLVSLVSMVLNLADLISWAFLHGEWKFNVWAARSLLLATSDRYRIPGLSAGKELCGCSIIHECSQHLKRSSGTQDRQGRVKANVIYSSCFSFPHSPRVRKAPLPPRRVTSLTREEACSCCQWQFLNFFLLLS